MTSPDPDSRKYVVYSGRKKKIYFWTGEKFTGDFSQALIHEKYGDTFDTIWRGTLDENMDKLREAGFRGLHPYPIHLIDDPEDGIKPEWRATDEFQILGPKRKNKR